MATPSNGSSKAQAAYEKGLTFKPYEFDLLPLEDDVVEVQIAYAGICHSDLSTVTGEWGEKEGCWPIVPGHEIVGIVTQVGKGVTSVKIGDRVGVGPQAYSCGTCSECGSNNETDCPTTAFTYATPVPTNGYITKGGYAHYHRTYSRFVFPIPAALPSDKVAPLLCAGVTMYTPLRKYNAGPGKTVGIVGIGGLGHLGVLYAHKMGATVVAISRSDDKKEEALAYGCSDFIVSTDVKQMKANAGRFDVILNTTSGKLPWSLYLNLLKRKGTWVQIGAPPVALEADCFWLLSGRVITGSLIGTPRDQIDMLNFSAEHNVLPTCEMTTLDNVNEAVQRVMDNKARYRIVMAVNPSIVGDSPRL